MASVAACNLVAGTARHAWPLIWAHRELWRQAVVTPPFSRSSLCALSLLQCTRTQMHVHFGAPGCGLPAATGSEPIVHTAHLGGRGPGQHMACGRPGSLCLLCSLGAMPLQTPILHFECPHALHAGIAPHAHVHAHASAFSMRAAACPAALRRPCHSDGRAATLLRCPSAAGFVAPHFVLGRIQACPTHPQGVWCCQSSATLEVHRGCSWEGEARAHCSGPLHSILPNVSCAKLCTRSHHEQSGMCVATMCRQAFC